MEVVDYDNGDRVIRIPINEFPNENDPNMPILNLMFRHFDPGFPTQGYWDDYFTVFTMKGKIPNYGDQASLLEKVFSKIRCFLRDKF